MSVDILGTSCDQCRSMVQYSFTSTESRRLVRTDSSGRPPRLSHSSWTMTSSGAHRQRYISTLPNRAQFSHATNRRVGEGQGVRALLHCCHPRGPRSGTIQPLCWGGPQPGSGRRPEILTKLSLPSRTNKYRLKNLWIQQTRGHGKTQKRKKQR